MTPIRRAIISLLCFAPLALIRADEGAPVALSPEKIEFFEKQVRPLFVKRCFECHGGTKAGGGLSLETASGWRKGGESGPAIKPGLPNESLLIEAINYRSLEMPPPDHGGKLPAEEIAVLTSWVEMGAPDPRDGHDVLGGMSRQTAQSWWAFQPFSSKTAVPVTDSDLAARIDQLLQLELRHHGLTQSPQADRRTLIRRVTYDLIGLPPTAEEVDSFVADPSHDAFDHLVERLLDSPQYGVHWGRHWLDVARYADTAGENTDRPLPHAWRYRNWVINSFNRDLPFDQFVRLQLAGDILGHDLRGEERAEAIIATGYLAIARRFGHDIEKDQYLTHEDVIDNLGKNFLGLTLGCARCHDHKYDPVAAEDYYALYGIFESTRFAFPGCEPKGQPRDMVPLIDPAEADSLNAGFQRKMVEFDQQQQAIKQAAQELQGMKPAIEQSTRVLAESVVGEGQSVSVHQGRESQLDEVALRKGDLLQLVVLPNANHGADTTRIQLEISNETGESRRTWNPESVIDRFTDTGPAIDQDGATWCLLDVTEGPSFLYEKKTSIQNQSALKGWSSGDTPSSLVNTSSEPVSVWTKLPPRALFLHPGQGRNVALAWICPADGTYRVRGVVGDAHPAPGLDGVSFRLEQISVTGLGANLVALGAKLDQTALPRPTPPTIPVAYAVVDREATNARFQLRGDPEKLGDEVPRHWLSVFGGDVVPASSGSGRRELGDWIARHPLTARVMVNRIWQWHFGRGLVSSSNDFGARGEQPTHPELLNLLAEHFVKSGYSVKAMHRLILKTSAWRQASASPDVNDPDNRWLAHFARRRLSAEEMRDSLLAVSGQLDLSMAQGHPFPAEATWTFTQHDPFNAVYETNRRSAFLMVQRQRRHPFLSLFDGADPNASTPLRQTTTVPTQALYFINDPFFHQQAELFSIKLSQLPADQEPAQFVYRNLFQREPTALEVERLHKFIAAYPASPAEAWSAYARVLLASNEFLHID